MLTPEQKTKYLEHKGVRCPHCDSSDLRTATGDRDDDYIIVEVSCEDCGMEWKDEYRLATVFDADEEAE